MTGRPPATAAALLLTLSFLAGCSERCAETPPAPLDPIAEAEAPATTPALPEESGSAPPTDIVGTTAAPAPRHAVGDVGDVGDDAATNPAPSSVPDASPVVARPAASPVRVDEAPRDSAAVESGTPSATGSRSTSAIPADPAVATGSGSATPRVSGTSGAGDATFAVGETATKPDPGATGDPAVETAPPEPPLDPVPDDDPVPAEPDPEPRSPERDEPPFAGPVSVLATPNAANVAPGSTVSVNVSIQNARNVASVPYHVTFDPAVLVYQGAREGPFLVADGTPTAFLVAPSGGGGRVVVGHSRLGGSRGASGDGELAVLEFLALAPGNAALAIERGSVIAQDGTRMTASFRIVDVTVR